ncbi:hypothetical protein CP533_0688 [Ophiocordyceps camponoti-saundersi (nom. inval.)]|nr:hypothetical protein CP533_0688 [Ophiocordyceps camponoti-saundersi (nom. inval.)]
MQLPQLLITVFALNGFTSSWTFAVAASNGRRCTMGEYNCRWRGKSPMCGYTNRMLGELDDQGRRLVRTTEHVSVSDLNTHPDNNTRISASCFQSYGLGCVAGYKRLYCDLSNATTADLVNVDYTGQPVEDLAVQ